MKSELIKISQLKSNNGQIAGLPKNPRVCRDTKFQKLKNSLIADPEMLELREVIAYDNGGELVVICGNMRLKALQELGIKEVPTKILPQETSVEKLQAYTIKDNVGFGEHDFEALANEWDAEKLDEWGLDVPVFAGDDTTGNFDDEGIDGKNNYGVIVICESAGTQESVFNDLTKMGFNCKIVVT